jgi:UDP-2,3-diacylglucosamine pyrophosphatase LpxH
MLSGYVISDLHLFTPWSVADDYMREIREAADRADFFVLNGDIFDFRWSSLASAEATVAASEAWLRAFAAEHPRCRVAYVMGNHDALRPFADCLAAAAEATPNLEWHPSHVRIGPALFTHGDLFLRKRPTDPFNRALRPAITRKPKTLSRCYRLLHSMRVHRWHVPVLSSRRCAKRIIRSLDAASNGDAEGITDIYFGHTHTTFTDHAYRGLRFHNTGSMIGGLPWRMLPVLIQ